MPGDDAAGGLSVALAAALADAEALAVQKTKDETREQVRAVVESVTADGADTQLGPAIRGMPAEDAVRRRPTEDVGVMRALREQQDHLRRQLDDERAQTQRLKRQRDDARSDLKATRQRFQRISDQFEEFQRRQSRQEVELPARLRKQLLLNFLPALDSLDRVTSNLLSDERLEPELQEGVDMLRASFERTLSLSEVVAFDATGQPFDPVVHEAISEEVSDEVPQGTVLRQVGRGYFLAGKLLRSAQVVVSRPA